jgi:hypothetical protein
VLEVRRQLRADLGRAHADLDVDARIAEPVDAGAAHALVGVFDADDDPPDLGGDERVGARSGDVDVRAGLEGREDRRPAGGGAGRVEDDDLGVPSGRRLGGAVDDLAVGGDEDGADPGPGRGGGTDGGRVPDRPPHHLVIQARVVHGALRLGCGRAPITAHALALIRTLTVGSAWVRIGPSPMLWLGLRRLHCRSGLPPNPARGVRSA